MQRTNDNGASLVSTVESHDWTYDPMLPRHRYSDVTIKPLGDTATIANYVEGSPVQRTIVAGSRYITDEDLVETALANAPSHWIDWVPSELVIGGADGVDTIARKLAEQDSNWDILTTFEPRWDKFGPAAGPKRNEEMAHYVGSGGALIAVWGNASSGTGSMIEHARELGLDYYVTQVDRNT